jgi:hypothetical protein
MRFPIHIRDHDVALLLDYDAFCEYHTGHALLGAIVGWRAMQRAAELLSGDDIWERQSLSVSARHAGPGVRDALEYVTRCFTRERFQSELAGGGVGPCGSAADFRFSVSDQQRVVRLELCDGVVPKSFFAAVSACRGDDPSEGAVHELKRQKQVAAQAVAEQGLATLFQVSVTSLMEGTEAGHA